MPLFATRTQPSRTQPSRTQPPPLWKDPNFLAAYNNGDKRADDIAAAIDAKYKPLAHMMLPWDLFLPDLGTNDKSPRPEAWSAFYDQPFLAPPDWARNGRTYWQTSFQIPIQSNICTLEGKTTNISKTLESFKHEDSLLSFQFCDILIENIVNYARWPQTKSKQLGVKFIPDKRFDLRHPNWPAKDWPTSSRPLPSNVTTWTLSDFLASYGLQKAGTTEQMMALREAASWAIGHNNYRPPLIHEEEALQNEIYKQLIVPVNILIKTRYRMDLTSNDIQISSIGGTKKILEWSVDSTTKSSRNYPHWNRPCSKAHCGPMHYTHSKGGKADFLLYGSHTPGHNASVMEVKTFWACADEEFDKIREPGIFSRDGKISGELKKTTCDALIQLWLEMVLNACQVGALTNGSRIIFAVRRNNAIILSKIANTSDGNIIQILVSLTCLGIDLSYLQQKPNANDQKNLTPEKLSRSIMPSRIPPEIDSTSSRLQVSSITKDPVSLTLAEHLLDHYICPAALRHYNVKK